jgi:hypothetical protein
MATTPTPAAAAGPCHRLAAIATQLRPPRGLHPAAAPAAAAPASAGPEVIYDPAMLAAFDEAQWRRDGYCVFPGIMTPECRRLWSASLRRCQAIQDHMIWHTDWEGAGSRGWWSHPFRRRVVYIMCALVMIYTKNTNVPASE